MKNNKNEAQQKKSSVGKSIAILLVVAFVIYMICTILSMTGVEVSPIIKIALPILTLIFGTIIIIIINAIKK